MIISQAYNNLFDMDLEQVIFEHKQISSTFNNLFFIFNRKVLGLRNQFNKEPFKNYPKVRCIDPYR
jgi:hypothetical protein